MKLEIPTGWSGPLYTIEGSPCIYVRWNESDVPVLTGHPAAWHEDRHKAGEETWALMLAVVACTNAAPALAERVEELEAALRFYADREHYNNDTEIARGDGTYDVSCSILDDEGATARRALGET